MARWQTDEAAEFAVLDAGECVALSGSLSVRIVAQRWATGFFEAREERVLPRTRSCSFQGGRSTNSA